MSKRHEKLDARGSSSSVFFDSLSSKCGDSRNQALLKWPHTAKFGAHEN
jgi:hypothetical protein